MCVWTQKCTCGLCVLLLALRFIFILALLVTVSHHHLHNVHEQVDDVQVESKCSGHVVKLIVRLLHSQNTRTVE